MKLNITIQPSSLNGYTNLCPLNGDDIYKLDVDDASCTEIIGDQVIDYIESGKLAEVLQGYVSKIRHKGKIILGGTDIIEVSKQCIQQAINLHEVNTLLYGVEDGSGWGSKRGCSSLLVVATILSQLGLTITKKRLDSNYFIVEAYRD